MDDSTVSQLHDSTDAWCDSAAAAVERPPDDALARLRLVREGILLRRHWDRLDPDAPVRRQMISLLATLQGDCHQALAERVDSVEGTGAEGADPDLTRLVADQITDDDRYLAGLLNDQTLPPGTAAFAAECFRDDLHWLGTQVAVLDGTRGIDFLGRVLLEQEALEHDMDVWQSEAYLAKQPTAGDGSSSDFEDLRKAAEDLRSAAVARRVETLLAAPLPTDCHGWRVAWQTAGRTVMRLDAALDDLREAVGRYREQAAQQWAASLADLPSQRRDAELREIASELADAANESLTFIEDIPLSRAVRNLQVLHEDASTCLEALKRHGSSETKRLSRTLKRRCRGLAGELQERRLGWRMESLFGHRAVAALERLILALLLVFMFMLVAEGPLIRYEQARWPGSNIVEPAFAWMDLGVCLVFMFEFCLKISLAWRPWLFLRRNWVTMLLPSVPFGFIAYWAHSVLLMVEAAEGFVLLRLFRLPRMVRWLRMARPVIRVGRLLAFALQASDRLVRQISPLLNRSLVLFERASVRIKQPGYRSGLAALRERFYHRTPELIDNLPPSASRRLVKSRIEDLTAMLSSPGVLVSVSVSVSAGRMETTAAREIPLESVIARLLAATPAGISERIGRSLAMSVTRWCRALDVLGIRRLPLVRDLVAAGRLPSPYETTAKVANRLGVMLRHLLDRVYWMADLYGTVTAPQLVDSVGQWMIKGTARPARRFLTIGIGFLAVSYLASLLPVLGDLSHSMEKLIGTPLVVLGVLCLVPLLLGLWFRQIAGEATDFYGRVAEAQSMAVTRALKAEAARRHRAVLDRRVIEPERAIQQDNPTDDRIDSAESAVELLWNDYLDGAPFHQSDTKTTTQLLGNLVLVSLRRTRLVFSRSRRKRLRRLDLANARVSLRGPYLWFHFISRSLAQHSAKLVVDYNAHALPICRAATADRDKVRGHVEWLSRRLDKPVDQLETPPEFRDRLAGEADPSEQTRPASDNGRRRSFHGNDFSAVHFLSADPQVEAEVRRRYGDLVADLMRRDRRDNIRRVFRTYPFHRWDKGRRTVNLLSAYHRHMEGGRVLLLPLKLLFWGFWAAVRCVLLLCGVVREVLYPTVGDLETLGQSDPVAVAVRKIHRMRKPLLMECLEMRAEFDPEYLGVALPGSTVMPDDASRAPVQRDLALVASDPGVEDRFRRLAAQRRRQMLDFRRWLVHFDAERQPRESLRAMAIAYAIDYRNTRSRLEAVGLLAAAFDEATEETRGEAEPVGNRGLGRLAALYCRLRYGTRISRLLTTGATTSVAFRSAKEGGFRGAKGDRPTDVVSPVLSQPAFAHYDERRRAVCRRLILQRRGPLLAATRLLTQRNAPADPLDDARRTLLSVARDPDTWSRQLVVLRTVQTLSVLDLRIYCDLVAELGEYDDYIPGDLETR